MHKIIFIVQKEVLVLGAFPVSCFALVLLHLPTMRFQLMISFWVTKNARLNAGEVSLLPVLPLVSFLFFIFPFEILWFPFIHSLALATDWPCSLDNSNADNIVSAGGRGT